MKGGEAFRAPPLGDVERIAQPVVVLVDLASRLSSKAGIAIGTAEAPGTVAVDVELGIAGEDQLSGCLSEATGPAEAVEREAGGGPKASCSRYWPEQRIPVRRHRIRMTDERNDTGVLEEREAAYRARHKLRESLVIG